MRDALATTIPIPQWRSGSTPDSGLIGKLRGSSVRGQESDCCRVGSDEVEAPRALLVRITSLGASGASFLPSDDAAALLPRAGRAQTVSL